MRRLVFPVLLVLALLLPAQSVLAQSIVCQTVNGPKSIGDLTAELIAAGYAGPWDAASKAAAYENASGGPARCGGTLPAPVVSGPPRDAVLMVGGFNSDLPGTLRLFNPLANALIRNYGFDTRDMNWFMYGGSSDAYTKERTCQPIDQTANEITAEVRRIRSFGRANGVILVGHSLGGVAALDALVSAPDLTDGSRPFVRAVVTVDSPLSGIGALDNLIDTLWHGYSYCEALNELQGMSANPGWAADAARWAMARGVRVAAVSNPDDLAVPDGSIAGLSVNFSIDAVDTWLNHEAVLSTASGAAQLAAVVGRQGQ